LEKPAIQTYSAASAISASSKIITGAFPPNSKCTFFKLLLAEFDNTSLPIGVDPVKLHFLISGCFEIASPASCPYPQTTLKRPLGNSLI